MDKLKYEIFFVIIISYWRNYRLGTHRRRRNIQSPVLQETQWADEGELEDKSTIGFVVRRFALS